jgi:hypothetical protein
MMIRNLSGEVVFDEEGCEVNGIFFRFEMFRESDVGDSDLGCGSEKSFEIVRRFG